MRKSTPMILAGAVLAGMAPVASAAVDYSFNYSTTSTNDNSGTWSDPSHWIRTPEVEPPSAPTAADNIVTPDASSAMQGDANQYGKLAINVSTAEVANWSYSSSKDWSVAATVTADLTISGTLSKAGTGTLTIRGTTLDLTIGDIAVSEGTLTLGTLRDVAVGSTTISGGRLDILSTGTADLGPVVFSGTGGNLTLNQNGQASGNVTVTSLSSASDAPIVASAETSSGNRNSTLTINGASGTATFAGKLRNDVGVNDTGRLTLIKQGGNTQILTGNANTYRGGTTIEGGALLFNNTAGSGSGTGAVTVAAAGTLGGTGRIAPTGANGVTIDGTLAPGGVAGDAIESFEIDLTGTTGGVVFNESAVLSFQLGAANADINSIADLSSDLLIVNSDTAGDVTFNNTIIDFNGTGEIGWYRLLDTTLDASTWSGLSFSGNTITGGLSVQNLAPGLSGTLVIGDGTNGSAGDIYLQVVPEPVGGVLLAGAGLLLARRRRVAA